MIKIGLSGAGGTGKGTIGKLLAQKLDVKWIPSPVETIGKLLEPGVDNYKEIQDPDLYQYCALTAQIQNELMVTGLGYVSERSIFDFIPYAKRRLTEEGMKRYIEYIWNAYINNPYDYIFFFPYDDFEVEDQATEWAKFRERDQGDRLMTDRELRKILYQNVNKTTEVWEIRGGVNDRLYKILGVLRRTTK